MADGMREMAPMQDDAMDDEIDLLALAKTLWQGKLLIAASTLIAAVLSVLYLLSTPPTYEADALLQLEEKGGQLGLPAGLQDLTGDTPRSVTEIEVIKSRLVLGRAVSDLNLDWIATPKEAPVFGYTLRTYDLPLPEFGTLATYARRDEAIALDILQVPPQWLGETITLTKTGANSFSALLPDGSELSGEVGSSISEPKLGLVLGLRTLDGQIGREFQVTQISEATAISGLRGRLSISESGRQSGILRLRYAAGDRLEAQRVLNAVTRSYVTQNVTRSAAEAQSSLQFIEQQLPVAEATVVDAESALNGFRQSQDSVDVTFETESLLTQVNAVDVELDELSVEEDALAQRYQPNHPTYRQLLNRKSHLQERRAELQEKIGALPDTQQQVISLTRDLELAQNSYLELLKRAQELRVLEASTLGNVRVIDTAQTAPQPIAPRKARILALAIIMGLILGCGIVLLRAMLRKGVQNSEEIEKVGLPVLATINKVAGKGKLASNRKQHDILAISEPTNLSVEAFRNLRTSLHFSMLDAGTKSIVMTSPAPGAGKSFNAMNLAVVSAQAGIRVCLVDADMRRGELRKYFSVKKNEPGLADLLAGDRTLTDVLRKGPIDGLSFIPTGPYPPNPSELLLRPNLKELIDTLDQDFDLVILDAPPTLAVADPIILSREAGTTLAVVRHDTTQAAEIEAMIRSFAVSGLRINGAILNDFDRKKVKAGAEGHSSYRYSYETRE